MGDTAEQIQPLRSAGDGLAMTNAGPTELVIQRRFAREATSSVDNETEALIQRSLERIAVGRTTIIIAHRLHTVTRTDDIVVLEDGRLVEQGRHDELMEADAQYRSLFDMQIHAGGIVCLPAAWTAANIGFQVSDSEGGTYYIGETKLTVENAEAALRCIEQDGLRVVRVLEAVDESMSADGAPVDISLEV